MPRIPRLNLVRILPRAIWVKIFDSPSNVGIIDVPTRDCVDIADFLTEAQKGLCFKYPLKIYLPDNSQPRADMNIKEFVDSVKGSFEHHRQLLQTDQENLALRQQGTLFKKILLYENKGLYSTCQISDDDCFRSIAPRLQLMSTHEMVRDFDDLIQGEKYRLLS